MADQSSKTRKTDEINKKFTNIPDSYLSTAVGAIATGLYPD